MNTPVNLSSKKTHYIDQIKAHFPNLYFASQLITKGWDNDALILDNKIVFRFPKKDVYARRFKGEIELLQYLSTKTNISIPEYCYLPDNRDFGGYMIIPGTELTLEIFTSLTEYQKLTIAEQLGEFLSILHETPLKKATETIYTETDDYWWSEKHAKNVIAGLHKKVFPKLNYEEQNWIDQLFQAYLSLPLTGQKTLTHSDFVDDHIFIDNNKGCVTGIIDFSDMEISDPAFDFSGLWEYGSDFVSACFNTYRHANKADNNFLERSKFPRLASPAGNMFEIENGDPIPETFAESRHKLRALMDSGLSLSGNTGFT